jgi:hypothetical protein
LEESKGMGGEGRLGAPVAGLVSRMSGIKAPSTQYFLIIDELFGNIVYDTTQFVETSNFYPRHIFSFFATCSEMYLNP